MPSMVFTFDTFQFFMSRVWSAAQSANRRCMFVTFDTSQFAASIFEVTGNWKTWPTLLLRLKISIRRD